MEKWERDPGQTQVVKRPGQLSFSLWPETLVPWSDEAAERQVSQGSDGPWGKFRKGGTHLDRKLQNHVDDPFPAAGEVEPFGEPDSEAPNDRTEAER